MNKIKKMIMSVCMVLVFLIGTTFGQKGIILSDSKVGSEQLCTEQTKSKTILITNYGIIVLFTGIIILLKEDNTNCGIIVL